MQRVPPTPESTGSGLSTIDTHVPTEVELRLAAEAARHADAAVSRSLEENNRHFQDAREKFEKCVDDSVLAAEKALSRPPRFDSFEKVRVWQEVALAPRLRRVRGMKYLTTLPVALQREMDERQAAA